MEKKKATEPAKTQYEVIGGASTGGIVVRNGANLSSPEEPQRLATGAQVERISVDGNRVQYKLLSGNGPPTGWVNLTMPKTGNPLLRLVET
mmetsp:Transcript_37083/g.77798  ORF Transcript_37083/g.77798 Transcript_37083/m.77798 type:complete len:91 (+) Transcript_37083:1-273(+)